MNRLRGKLWQSRINLTEKNWSWWVLLCQLKKLESRDWLEVWKMRFSMRRQLEWSRLMKLWGQSIWLLSINIMMILQFMILKPMKLWQRSQCHCPLIQRKLEFPKFHKESSLNFQRKRFYQKKESWERQQRRKILNSNWKRSIKLLMNPDNNLLMERRFQLINSKFF